MLFRSSEVSRSLIKRNNGEYNSPISSPSGVTARFSPTPSSAFYEEGPFKGLPTERVFQDIVEGTRHDVVLAGNLRAKPHLLDDRSV